ncbi:MAG TPA: metallophosphoesterase family protein [Sphingomonadaceae bacterium]|nr:metallophosphoesterase family protein [Sphingomonadaceae bacterium]
MTKSIRQLLGLSGRQRSPRIPSGRRIYAIGDIHGRLDLFEALLEAIERDDREAPKAKSTVILLGDLVDRGPDSAGVIKRARKLQKGRDTRVLAGNHEEMFLLSFDRKDVLRHFLRFGGRETLRSYGINQRPKNKKDLEALQRQMKELIPRKDVKFIREMEDRVTIGDYAFVHAGILPKVKLADQSPVDLRWIREPFLSSEVRHSHIIVHGHTIYNKPELRENRIGIDTGAFASGRLTALVLEGTGRRFIETRVKKGVITTRARKAEL